MCLSVCVSVCVLSRSSGRERFFYYSSKAGACIRFFFYISGLQTRICNLSPLALKFVSTKVKIFPNFAALRRLGFVITNLKPDSANPKLRLVSHVVSMYIYYQISTFTIVCMYKLLLS